MSKEVQIGDEIPSALLASLPAASAGTRFRVLYFMRTIDCVICRAHVRRLRELAPTLQKSGADVVVFAPAVGAANANAWIAEQPFPILQVTGAHESAGLGRALFGQVQQSGTVVVDAQGRAVLVRRATLPFQSFDEGELLARLAGPSETTMALDR